MWNYTQPVQITFGNGVSQYVRELITQHAWQRGILIATPHVVQNGVVATLLSQCQGRLTTVFSGITPNPDVADVDACAAIMRQQRNEFVVAVGGGSTLDLAKAAATICLTDESIRAYHGTGKTLPSAHLPLIALPTTAGTGSEVTAVSVLSNREAHQKAPLSSPNFFPDYAIVDPVLTYDLPPYVTACCGIDVLAHALEGYWNIHHQPICDAQAIQASRLVFDYLPRAVANGRDQEAREKMCEASLLAGLAFALPKTTSSHACSFPLTNLYDIPHGEACGLTLDYFARLNGRHDKRVQQLAGQLGFPDTEVLADAVLALKKQVHLRCDLRDFHLSAEEIDALVAASHYPNLLNNPYPVTDEILYDLYQSLI